MKVFNFLWVSLCWSGRTCILIFLLWKYLISFECLYVGVWTYICILIFSLTHKHIEYILIYIQKNIYIKQRCSQTLNCNGTFTDTKLQRDLHRQKMELNKIKTTYYTNLYNKKNSRNLSILNFLKKTKNLKHPQSTSIWNNKNLNTKFEIICKSIHFEIFTLLSLDQQQQQQYIYIYIYIYVCVCVCVCVTWLSGL